VICNRVPAVKDRKPRFIPEWKNREKYEDCVAVDAVAGELFSAPSSLLTGKNTGNFSSMIQPSLDKSRIYGGLARKLRFPDESEQGINRG
jgi:hypothetical protein